MVRRWALAGIAVSSLAGALAPALMPGVAIAAGAAAGPSVWVVNAADRVFKATPAGTASTVALYAARNEYEAAQLAVRSTVALSNVSVTAGALTGPGGATIPATNIRIGREYLHPVIEKITGDAQTPPDGSDDYYDALVENIPIALAANATQPYLYQVYVPAGQAPGVYSGSATVHSSGGDVAVPVTVKVYPVTVPPANQATLRVNNWTT